MNAESLVMTGAGKPRVFCCHKAVLSGAHHPNSLEAVAECVTARVPRLEIDVQFLADDSMLVFHDHRLDHETTGHGATRALTRASARLLRYRSAVGPPLAFLEEVVDLVRGSMSLLQVDLKLMRPITADRARALIEVLAPIRDHVIVGCQAHWNLRPLAAAGLRIALDPSLHWHYFPGRSGEGLVPAREGLHGLWDDAPIAHTPAVTAADYLRTRIDDLTALLSAAVEWMVDERTCLYIAALGVPLGLELERRGIELAAWTIEDRGIQQTTMLLDSLFQLGATTLITDSPRALAAYAAQLA